MRALRTGRYASTKYGLRKASKRLPVMPSIVSSMGSTWMRLPYLTSVHWVSYGGATVVEVLLKMLRT